MAKLQEDIRRLRFWRSIIAEFLGCLFIVFIGCSSFTVTYSEHALAVKVALAFGLTYMVMLYCMRPVSDAHLNSVVTIALLVTRRTSVIRALLYLGSQILGSIIGAALVFGVTSSNLRHVTGNHSWSGGCTVLATDVSQGQGFGVEFLATFVLVFVVFSCYDKSKTDHTAPFVIGLTYVGVIIASLPYTGGSVNTARSFGPALVNNIWTDHWIYWFGPLLGGICGGAVFDVIFSTKSSFTRIRACFTVFHPQDTSDTGQQQAEKDVELGTTVATGDDNDKNLKLSSDKRRAGDRTDANPDELEALSSQPVGTSTSDHKPRLKFVRPKFACCGGDEATKDEVPAGPEDVAKPADNDDDVAKEY